METTNASIDTNLSRGLADLYSCADPKDITRTAADLEIGVETVRRYLRGQENATDENTAKQIHDHLRNLTLIRTHSTLEKLNAA